MGLKLASVSIKNVLGIEELELTPDGNIIEVSGKNGTGKTSTCEAIKDALGVSDYSSLLRDGAEKGEVVLDLGEMQIKKAHKPNGETLTVKGKVAGTDKMSTISSPAGVLKSLVNPNSVDPVRLLSAKPKELLDVVLGALPMTVDVKKFTDIVGRHSIDVEQHALVAIAQATKLLMEERKLLNRDAKTAKTTKEQLAATLPDNIPMTEELEQEIQDNIESSERIRTKARTAARTAKQSFQAELDELSEESLKLQKQIDELSEKLQEVQIKITINKKSAESASEAAREETLAKAQDYLDRNIGLSKELSSVNVYKNTQSQVKQWETTEAKATLESDALTKSLKALQEYKEDLCDDLPIEGLAIVDGKLSMNGIPFETLNTAERVKLVVELAKLTAGNIGVVVIDNSENLDADTYKLFIEEARKTDLTFVVARVENHDFEVK